MAHHATDYSITIRDQLRMTAGIELPDPREPASDGLLVAGIPVRLTSGDYAGQTATLIMKVDELGWLLRLERHPLTLVLDETDFSAITN